MSTESGPEAPGTPEIPGGTETPDHHHPRLDSLVRDIGRDKVGVVMAILGRRIFLQPLGGGREWETAVDGVRPLKAREELSVRLAVANARSRRAIR